MPKETVRRSVTSDIGHLGPGKYFGEMALVSDAPRAASCICNTHCILMSVGKEVFHSFFDNNPQAAVEFNLRLLQAKSELKHVLEHPHGLKAFTDFLKIELADENIVFWSAHREYSKNPSNQAAINLYELYLSEKAALQVNIPGTMRSEIKKNIDAGEGGPDVFIMADKEIYKLMVRDNFARFRKSDLFKTFFVGLGIFIDVAV